ncbi:hypothetical protein GCM10007862_15540 [Dyella lipolytica]|uniref:DUF4265 domain-containing protein n=1 Tax=Dyella lipolytica TaxID=1867835 RepID=A0ABW8IVA6_9GAMM|nr:DUF4265 domain-containing protein [Dyella lipolytica]GLQ46503.1 hypothetical protein GCM10007862_15540 [Dyella lipolytica]
MTEQVKIHFRLEQDEDGYPEVAVESVWATKGTKSGEYVLDNIPFFFRGATVGDTVSAYEDGGNLWFAGLTQSSSNSLVRVVFFDRECQPRIAKALSGHGCEVEYFEKYNLLAVSIPGNIKLSDVQAYLALETDAGSIDYEEPILRQ